MKRKDLQKDMVVAMTSNYFPPTQVRIVSTDSWAYDPWHHQPKRVDKGSGILVDVLRVYQRGTLNSHRTIVQLNRLSDWDEAVAAY